MSTGQQLGLIGNSIKVQSLPTASAETFGAGNRFYTLIGQQEGYITGHTYRTVVANDVYSWEDVAGGNYNMLDNIPVINQDLSASGFTPVANTYYRHTGSTTAAFTQGVIYCYDGTEYKALDGSGGGGTTLNKYTYGGSNMALVQKIMNESEVSYFDFEIDNTPCVLPVAKGGSLYRANGTVTSSDSIVSVTITKMSNALYMRVSTLKNTDNVLSFSSDEYAMSGYTRIVYFNGTEITA